MAAAYEQFVLDRSSQESLRSAGNGVALIAALIAAPETAGGSYAAYLTVARGVVASVDIALKNDRLKLNSDADFKAKYQSYYDVWDIFYNSVLLADAGAGVYSLANNLRKVNLVNATKTFYTKMKDFDFNGELMGVWNKLRGVGVTRFIAKTGKELEVFLKSIPDADIPKGISYKGKMYRYKETAATYEVTSINPTMDPLKNRYKKGLYTSETTTGNKIEVDAFGGTTGKTQYEFEVDLENLLDLTDDATIQKLGTSFDQMKLSGVANKYEYTHIIADWAKSKGYSGIKFYGAQGSTDYVNFVVFEQTTVDNSLIKSATPTKW
ncbi:MAG: hypothetical protein H6Q20_2072 [Bacteroidetes bacterium]|nr:hypothetical protein [Bacteroidota bacterium]